MKQLVIAIVAVATLSSGFAEEEKLKFSEMTPEQRKEVRRINLLKRTGGYLERREKDSGKFLVVNAQKRVGNVYTDQLKVITDIFEVEMQNKAYDKLVGIENAKAVLKELGGAMGVFIIDRPEYPTLSIFPESGYGFINVAALAADKAGQALLEKRVTREVWRAFAMVGGSTDTEWDPCLLGPVASLRDLDTLKAEAVSPEPMGKIGKHLPKFGVKPFKKVSYRTACQEGWAPQPTNEFQKAIWDQVHELPKAPLKLEK